MVSREDHGRRRERKTRTYKNQQTTALPDARKYGAEISDRSQEDFILEPLAMVAAATQTPRPPERDHQPGYNLPR